MLSGHAFKQLVLVWVPGPTCLAVIQFSNWESATKVAVGFVTISYYCWKWRTDYLDRKERKLKEANQ